MLRPGRWLESGGRLTTASEDAGPSPTAGCCAMSSSILQTPIRRIGWILHTDPLRRSAHSSAIRFLISEHGAWSSLQTNATLFSPIAKPAVLWQRLRPRSINRPGGGDRVLSDQRSSPLLWAGLGQRDSGARRCDRELRAGVQSIRGPAL